MIELDKYICIYNMKSHAFNIVNLWILHHLSLGSVVEVALQSENLGNRIVF
jgi:hypothetical protein